MIWLTIEYAASQISSASLQVALSTINSAASLKISTFQWRQGPQANCLGTKYFIDGFSSSNLMQKRFFKVRWGKLYLRVCPHQHEGDSACSWISSMEREVNSLPAYQSQTSMSGRYTTTKNGTNLVRLLTEACSRSFCRLVSTSRQNSSKHWGKELKLTTQRCSNWQSRHKKS